MDGRRELKTRQAGWAQALAAAVARTGLTPNAISCISVVFAALAAFFLNEASRRPERFAACMVLAVVSVQLRLLMNMLDGMVAVEHGKKSPTGDLFNEIPDRIADVLILGATGFVVSAEFHPWPLAAAACVLAVATAYLRALGASLGMGHKFLGPMAKQHRMALLCAACLAAIFWRDALGWAMIAMNLGMIVTCWHRVSATAAYLNAKG